MILCWSTRLLLLLVLFTPAAQAHGYQTAMVALRELSTVGQFEVRWSIPVEGPDAGEEGTLELPSHCRRLDTRDVRLQEFDLHPRWQIDCGARGLFAQHVGVVFAPSAGHGVVLRVHFRDGRTLTALLTASQPSTRMPALQESTQSTGSLLRSFAALGVRHIATGFDHLLFVLGLLLLARAVRPAVVSITAFTVGHSLTLALAALSIVRVPAAPIEALIAASIVWVMADVLRHRAQSLSDRHGAVMAGVFGLLHGLGFASALMETTLPVSARVAALGAFNVGVELGQLAFALVVWGLGFWVRRWPTALQSRALGATVYAAGALGAFWFFMRVGSIVR